MRKLLLCTVFTAAVLGLAQRAGASEGIDDLAKMAKAGVNEDVMMAFRQRVADRLRLKRR